ncbi:hypothetical protein HMPREF0742_02362 [Rothia aeria F0184]|uniref:Uncharacterized protein n=1 Tax=Rothia aeria F0184 TaxID=888019 RepID=U7UXZ4_9MICC|nr:hypothetical protein HMPREF0742_02362 [Rothia aeria F0184]
MAAAAFGALASPVRVKLASRAICGTARKLRAIGRRGLFRPKTPYL